METLLHINYGNQALHTSRASLVLGQEEWHTNTGFVTKAAFFKYMFALLRGVDPGSVMSCGFQADGTIASVIYAYPSDPNLAYSLKTTYGSLSARRILEYIQKEVINFSLSNSASLKYPMNGDLAYEWVGHIYDFYGNRISPPAVSIDGDQLTLSRKVYGSLALQYPVMRHEYTLVAQARSDGTMDLFGAVVYAPFTGGISWLEITNPPNADEIALGGECGVSIGDREENPNAPFSPPECPQINITETYDYCSQDLISVEKEYV